MVTCNAYIDLTDNGKPLRANCERDELEHPHDIHKLDLYNPDEEWLGTIWWKVGKMSQKGGRVG